MQNIQSYSVTSKEQKNITKQWCVVISRFLVLFVLYKVKQKIFTLLWRLDLEKAAQLESWFKISHSTADEVFSFHPNSKQSLWFLWMYICISESWVIFNYDQVFWHIRGLGALIYYKELFCCTKQRMQWDFWTLCTKGYFSVVLSFQWPCSSESGPVWNQWVSEVARQDGIIVTAGKNRTHSGCSRGEEIQIHKDRQHHTGG